MPGDALGLNSDSYTSDILVASTDLYLSENLIPNVFDGVTVLKMFGGKDMIDMTQDGVMAKKDTLRLEDGGQSIFVPLMTAESTLYQALDEYELISTRAERMSEPAFVPWREVVVPATMSRRERKLNQGSTRIFDIWDQRLKQAQMTFISELEKDLIRGDQTDSDLASVDLTKRPYGISYYVEEDPDATTSRSVANVSVADGSTAKNTWWQNQSNLDAGNSIADTITFATDGIKNLLRLGFVADGGEGVDEADIYLTDSDIISAWWDEIDDLMRFRPGEKADLGAKLFFRGVPIFRSKFLDSVTFTGIYGLCSAYWQLVFQKDSFFARDGERSPYNQLSYTEIFVCMLNLICTNRRRQFILTGLS